MKEHVNSAAIYAGAIMAGISINDICAIIGVLLAIAGFLFNIWSKERMIKILREKNELTLKE